MFCNRLNSAFIKFNAGSIMAVLLAIYISCGSLITLQHVYAGSPISVVAQHPFVGSDGKVNVVGVVKNNGSVSHLASDKPNIFLNIFAVPDPKAA